MHLADAVIQSAYYIYIFTYYIYYIALHISSWFAWESNPC